MSTLNEALSELGLSANPFAKETPLESLFPGGMRRASLDQLQLLARESGDIIALIGADGSGKTTLADFYARRAERDQIVARTRASMLTSPSQLLQEMFKAFVLDFPPQASMSELKAVLVGYFQAVQDKSRSIVYIVDDAHELGDDAFNLLTKLALVDNPGNTFHLILVGQEALLEMLDYTCPQKNGQNQFTSVRLPEFSLDETRNYLRYRLNAVGFNDQDPARALLFNNRQVEKIHKLSNGVPGQINAVASEMLLSRGKSVAALLEPLRQLNVPPKYAYAAGALLVILLIAFFVGGADPEVETAQRQIVVPVPVRNASSVATQDVPEQQRAVSPFADSAVTPTPSVPSVSEPQAVAAPTPIVIAPAPAPAQEPTPEPEEPVPANPPAVATASVPRTPEPQAAPRAARVPQAVAAATENAGQAQLILALPDNQFTVQLLGAASRTNVEAFVQRNPSAPLYWFETENQGRPWYVVIHGSYASRAAAQTAANALGGELGALQPWIRSLGAVHRDIEASN